MKQLRPFKTMLGLLFSIVIVFCVAHYFLFQDIKNKNKKVSELQSSIELQAEREKYIKSVEDIVQSTQGGADKINSSIIGKDEDVNFIEKLESIAQSNGLEISIDSLNIDNVSSMSKANMTTLNIKAKTSGSWAGTYAFLSEIESMPFFVRLDKFGILNVPDNSLNTDQKKPVASRSNWQSVFEMHVLKSK